MIAELCWLVAAAPRSWFARGPDKGVSNIFDMRGIDRDTGCLIVVRPDQYVAHVLPLDAYDELAAFFDGFLVPAERAGNSFD